MDAEEEKGSERKFVIFLRINNRETSTSVDVLSVDVGWTATARAGRRAKIEQLK